MEFVAALMSRTSVLLAESFAAYQVGQAEPKHPSLAHLSLEQAILPWLWHQTGKLPGVSRFGPVARVRSAYADLVHEGVAQAVTVPKMISRVSPHIVFGDALERLGADYVAEVTGKVLAADTTQGDFRAQAFQRLGVPGIKELARRAYSEKNLDAAKILGEVILGADEHTRVMTAREVLLPLQSGARPLENFDYSRAIHEYLTLCPKYFPYDDSFILSFVENSRFILSGEDSKIRSRDVMLLMAYIGRVASAEHQDVSMRRSAQKAFNSLLSGHIDFFSECVDVFRQLPPLTRLIFLRALCSVSMTKYNDMSEVTRSGSPKVHMPYHEYYAEELWPFSNGEGDVDVRAALRFLESGELMKLGKFLDRKIAEGMRPQP